MSTSSPFGGHDRSRPKPPEDDEEEDPVEKAIKKTGCLELHYKVQVNSQRVMWYFGEFSSRGLLTSLLSPTSYAGSGSIAGQNVPEANRSQVITPTSSGQNVCAQRLICKQNWKVKSLQI